VFAAGLLACLLLAHYLGDFTPLSTGRMLEAKAAGGPVSLIASHAGVQTILVALVVAVASGFDLRLIAVVVAIEFVTHFAIDDPTNRAFWWVLGLDQLAHCLVLVLIAFLVTG
jgi:uncharacterized membrane protein AbrB (regulator of aidB expression)